MSDGSDSNKQSRSEALGQINRYHLSFAGYSPSDIVGFGDLSKLGRDRMEGLIRTKRLEEAGRDFNEAGVRTKGFHEDDDKE